MAVAPQLFAASHAGAVARADALDAGREPAAADHVTLPDVTPMDVELLGEIAARTVRVGTGELEPADVDLDHEGLYQLPTFLCDVLAELGRAEDPEAPADAAAAWAATEEMADAGDLLPVVTAAVALVTRAQLADQHVYLYVPTP